jgi:hypothetical protein
MLSVCEFVAKETENADYVAIFVMKQQIHHKKMLVFVSRCILSATQVVEQF